MAKLCIHLQPFSPDYSGVATVFYPLNALAVLHDASGCSGTYCGYDEPRWYGSHTATVCSGLREMDAVLGNDKKLVDNMLEAAEELKTSMFAVIGSPVPMVVGCDAKGIARELETKTGLPGFGFDTTGTRYYDYGIDLAQKELMSRFLEDSSERAGVNILGADYFDFPSGAGYVLSLLESAGINVNAVMPPRTIDDVRRLSRASISVVLSLSGIGTAERLSKEYGIPYITGVPYGVKGTEVFLSRVRSALHGEISGDKSHTGDDVLIVGECISSQAISDALYYDYGLTSTVASIYSDDRKVRRDGDLFLRSELEIIRLVRDKRWGLIIADPEFHMLKPAAPLIGFPAHTISSRLHESLSLFGDGFEEHIGRKCHERSL